MKINASKFSGCLLISFFLILSCRKEPAVPSNPTSLTDPEIYNILVSGNGSISFQRTVGGQYMDNLTSVKQTSDGGYILCGYTENEEASFTDIYLLKTDQNGNTLWSKRFSDSYSEYGYHIEIANDNGFVIAATTTLSAPAHLTYPLQDGQVIKTDSLGNEIWKRNFNFSYYDSFNTVKQTSDGGYIVCGWEGGGNVGLLLKLDQSGNEQWRKTFNGHIELQSLQITNDGGFIMCGSKKTTLSGLPHPYLIRTDSNGDTLWTKQFNFISESSIKSICEVNSGSFVLCGRNTNPNSGFVSAIDSVGTILWNVNLGNQNIESSVSLCKTTSGEYLIANQLASGLNANLMKLDSYGNIIWMRNFSFLGSVYLNELQPTLDGGYIVAGCKIESGNGNGLIIKTDIFGN